MRDRELSQHLLRFRGLQELSQILLGSSPLPWQYLRLSIPRGKGGKTSADHGQSQVSLSHVPLAPLFPSHGAWSGRVEHHGEAKLLTSCGGKAERQGGANPLQRYITSDLPISPTFKVSTISQKCHQPGTPPSILEPSGTFGFTTTDCTVLRN